MPPSIAGTQMSAQFPVKSIVESHAGQVSLSSLMPHGLQVRMVVPLAR